MRHPRCDRTQAWGVLQGHYEAHGRDFDLREAFARDPDRARAFTIEAPEVVADLSKNRIDLAARRFLCELARECGLEAQRDAMFAGEPINVTEGRAVLHTALRAPRGMAPFSDAVHETLDAMLEFAETVRAGGFDDVLHLGIGGSDLGPAMAVQALDAHAHRGIRLHFVSNVDGHAIDAALRGLEAQRTLVIVASKSFSTAETMANAEFARQWLQQQGVADLSRHLVAGTANRAAAVDFGAGRVFGFADWVGGRFSLWSAIGLPIAIALGAERFRELLAGAHAMDRHFAEAPIERNLPVQLGLLDLWNRNFHRFGSRCIAPYHQGLARLPAYLQQLEMESLGKRVDLGGEPLPYATSPVIWGEPGTAGQHSFFQMLHQGSDVVPVEFVLVRQAAHGHAELHRQLLAHGLAQSQALMLGRASRFGGGALARHRECPGNRPSTTFVLAELTPRSLGALIALYEHRVFTAGALWGIDAFDQWGVELGKTLCNDLLPRLESGDIEGLDASTAALLTRLRS